VLLTDIEERKRAEDALRESEQEARLIVDTIPGLVATLTPGGGIDLVNKQVLAYCGRTLEELKQWGTSDTVHPEDLPRVTEIISQSMVSGDPFEIEERIRRFDGVYRWFQVRGLPLRDPDGRIVRWYVLLTDIDARRRAEDALRASELNFQLTVDTIPGMVHTMTATGDIEFVNHQILDFLARRSTSSTIGMCSYIPMIGHASLTSGGTPSRRATRSKPNIECSALMAHTVGCSRVVSRFGTRAGTSSAGTTC
jgi:PAS domain S-box-containing protein